MCCLFCLQRLGNNEAIEHFPVGRRLAFDPAKGRLWVVCRKCERWNLTPLEERWEAIEECERAMRVTDSAAPSSPSHAVFTHRWRFARSRHSRFQCRFTYSSRRAFISTTFLRASSGLTSWRTHSAAAASWRSVQRRVILPRPRLQLPSRPQTVAGRP